MAFNEIPRPTDWLNYILPKEGHENGLQGAHIFSDKEWGQGKRFEFLKELGFDPNHFMNGSFNPETQRGGYVLGTAVHSGKQVLAFDDLQFDNGPNERTSARFMNTIKRELDLAKDKLDDGRFTQALNSGDTILIRLKFPRLFWMAQNPHPNPSPKEEGLKKFQSVQLGNF